MNATEKEEKRFKAMNENGRCCEFSMKREATLDEARRYIMAWVSMSVDKSRIVRVWECA